MDMIDSQATFEELLHKMFDHIWDCEINHPFFQDTVGDLMKAVMQAYNNLKTENYCVPYYGANMDLISKRVAIDAIVNTPSDVYSHDRIVSALDGAAFRQNEIIDIINALPSTVPERKKGRWIPVDSFSAFGGDEELWMAHGNPVAFYYCSNCKEQAYAGEDGESLITDYCPNCGADMRGEQNETD